MSDLRAWLDACELAEETITVKGRKFLVIELDLAERGRLFSDYHKGKGEISNEKAEGLLLCRCVLDPETRQQVVPCEEWKYWQSKGTQFSKLLRAVLRLNGLQDDPVDDEVKG